MKRLKNILLRVFFSCCLLFALLTAAQAAEPTRYEVNTAAELVDAALKVNAAGGEAEIVLKADEQGRMAGRAESRRSARHR